MVFLTVALAVSLLLSASIDAVQASDASDKNSDPAVPSTNGLTDFQLKLSEYLSKGNASELLRIRQDMAHHNILNKNINPENPPLSSINATRSESQTDSEDTRYLADISWASEPMVNPYTLQTIGFIDHAEYAVGDGPDGYSTHMETTDWYDNTGGEAIAWGPMSDTCSGRSEVHIVGKRAQVDYSCPPWYNYLIIGFSTNSYDWDYSIYCEVQSYDFFDITVGSTDNSFNYLAIFSWCPVGVDPREKSSFYIDSVEVIEHPLPTTLTIYPCSVYYGLSLNPTVYVDGNPVSTGPIQMEINPGWHTIYLDYTVWDPYFNCYAHLYILSDGLSNGDYRWIDYGSNYFLTAYYVPG